MKRILTTLAVTLLATTLTAPLATAEEVNSATFGSVNELNDQALATCGQGNSRAVLDCLVRYGATAQADGQAKDSREPTEQNEEGNIQ